MTFYLFIYLVFLFRSKKILFIHWNIFFSSKDCLHSLKNKKKKTSLNRHILFSVLSWMQPSDQHTDWHASGEQLGDGMSDQRHRFWASTGPFQLLTHMTMAAKSQSPSCLVFTLPAWQTSNESTGTLNNAKRSLIWRFAGGRTRVQRDELWSWSLITSKWIIFFLNDKSMEMLRENKAIWLKITGVSRHPVHRGFLYSFLQSFRATFFPLSS